MVHRYFSQRKGHKPPTTEIIGPRFWGGLCDAIESMMAQGLFMEEFPIWCQDGNGIYETDLERVNQRMFSEIGIQGMPSSDKVPPNHEVMDVIEFFGRYVSKPQTETPHGYWRHTDYGNFDKEKGYAIYSDRINELFQACGHPFELKEGEVNRHGPDALHQILISSTFTTGDPELDKLLEGARARFLDPDPDVRRESLEKLWDAWERLKTLEDQDKKKGIEKLLDKSILCAHLKEEIEKEAKALTKIGNEFRIRHHEVGKTEIQNDKDVDYLFYRMYGLIWRLLKGTNRVS